MLRRRLSLGGLALALFIVTAAVGNFFVPAERAVSLRSAGYDFLAFYTAGSFARGGEIDKIYDLDAVRAFQHDVAQRHGMEMTPSAVGPFWNPPFYAWVFAPLSALPYPAAFAVWTGINVACFVGASALLCRVVARAHRPRVRGLNRDKAGAAGAASCTGEAPVPRHADWRTWALVPLLMATSIPFITSIGHGQNTCVSLLILTGAVALWRGGRFFAAGAVAGLLFYKPQLAAVVAAVMIVCCGWRALAGLAMTGTALLLATLLSMPGALETYWTKMPGNLAFMQVQRPYLWERHVTLRAFWRLLVQGHASGETSTLATTLYIATAAIVAAGVVACGFKLRGSAARDARVGGNAGSAGDDIGRNAGNASGAAGGGGGIVADSPARDRVISVMILATPLLMPFYFDYDLLLLAVAAALAARDALVRGVVARGATACWVALYAWLIVNPHVAAATRVNGTVVLLAMLAGATMTTALRRPIAVGASQSPQRPRTPDVRRAA